MKQKPLSVSYIKTLLQCKQQFYFKYHTDLDPITRGDARPFGIAVHEALEFMGNTSRKRKTFPTGKDYERVFGVFLKSAVKHGLCDQALYDEGKQLLKQKLDSFSKDEKIIELELRFGYPYQDPTVPVTTKAGTPLTGAIDKIFELDKDTLVVLDYKTSRYAMTESEAAKDEQLSMYDLVCSYLYPQYSNIILVLDFLRLNPVITHRTEEDRVRFEKFLDTIYDYVGELKEEDIKPELNDFCGWCDYKTYCPAYKKLISDGNAMLRPLGEFSEEELVSEWVRFDKVKKAVMSYKMDLEMHINNVSLKGDGVLEGKNRILTKTQRSRVEYDPITVFRTLPKEDFLNLISIKKSALDKYLIDHPEYEDKVLKSASVFYNKPYLSCKKKG